VFSTTGELLDSLTIQCTYLGVSTVIAVTVNTIQLTVSYEVLIINYFSIGNNTITIVICVGGYCNNIERYVVTITVVSSTSRIFPYGLLSSDSFFTGVLDSARPIYLPQNYPIPYFDHFYTRLWVSDRTSTGVKLMNVYGSIIIYIANLLNRCSYFTKSYHLC